jgi:phospholipase C
MVAFPIHNVVVIVKENHTFDNFFAAFPGARGTRRLPHAKDPIPDPEHDHAAWLRAEDARKKGRRGGVVARFSKHDVGAYWALAEQYVLCDNYFTDVASQSEPNHLFLIAANAPIIDNASKHRVYQPMPPYDMESLPAMLQRHRRTWRNYANARSSYFDHIKKLAGHRWNVPAAQFDRDARAGNLPHVAWVYAPDGKSEHPGDWTGGPTVSPGVAWTVDRIRAITRGPQWPHTAVFLTWDDWGGWYDHVKPPLDRRWTGGGHAGYHNSQFRYGNRVPLIVISPYARQMVNHTFNSHASVVKFCLRLFGLPKWNAPALQRRDRSGDLWECFNFRQAPRLEAPRV